ncbi:sugar ABC transporter permease [Streptomyces sp. ISL-43]|uniref:sugar ABC transporter permease n=1 Tax=Streptomyces sp. ISL-43 TaxID=2819183 RepID=UPI0020362F55|nr:sugar ABC transporter permease [Streptomyces sp. ISL-43]
MSGPRWARSALADVLDRVAVGAAEAGDRFPLYADPETGRWTTTGRGSWAGGFWAGLLWLRARHTGAAADRAAASACTARLADWVDADTSTRGLILWYGTALAAGDTAARELRTRAAEACLAAMDAELGLVPWGSAFGGPRLLARVDGVPGMIPLLASAGPRGATAAASHLTRHLTLCLPAPAPAPVPHPTSDPAPAPGLGPGPVPASGPEQASGLALGSASAPGVVSGPVPGPDPASRPGLVPAWGFVAGAGWRPCGDPPDGWSRGRAWLLLALADVLHRPDVAGRLADGPQAPAERLADVWAGPGAALVPLADEAWPDGPLDTSAAAVTAVALLKLARVPGPGAARYGARAAAILERLADAHLSRGRLLDGCYDAGKGIAVRHELVWGTFFLALGLAELTGLLDIRDI